MTIARPAARGAGVAGGVRVLLLAGLGVTWLVGGLALWPSTCTPTLTPVWSFTGGNHLLNLGTSDLLLPLLLGVLVVRSVVEREPGRPPGRVVDGAVPLLVAAVVLLTGSLTVWALADPDFLVNKGISDTAKLK